jgi:4-amino-4-deoxy-L-arabinose transferase-like glycosyltransferase
MDQIATKLREDKQPLLIALLVFVAHALTNWLAVYDYFRDEFYFIACTGHMDWGYVDHPPLSILILWFNRLILGDSMLALRIPTAIASAAVVYLTGILVRELGGEKRAQLLACISVAGVPIYLLLGDFYSMNAFEALFWMGAAFVLVRILKTGNQELWILFGIIAGLGVQNKHSMVFFCLAIVAGLLLTRHRSQFLNKWIWLGGALAGLIVLPNLIWLATHSWATLEFLQRAQQLKNAPMSVWGFLSAQILFQHPLAAPLWIGGIAALFFHKAFRTYRLFGMSYVLLFALFVLQRGKPYYLSPLYPVILAAGAIAFEQYVLRTSRLRILRAYGILLTIAGLATMPLFLSLTPPKTFISIMSTLGINDVQMERMKSPALPQVLADRFGWKELTRDVSSVFHSLTPEEQSKAAIYTQNYGEAGAIDFFGRQYGLPKAISGHNNYWYWGPRGFTGEVLIIVGGRKENHQKGFESVELAMVHMSEYAMPFESHLPIYVCRRARAPVEELWSKVKFFI